MLNHQLVEALRPPERALNSVLALWLYPADDQENPITEVEEIWASQLSRSRSKQFRRSRGRVRCCLADLWNIQSLDIPLSAPPGQPPELEPGWGFVSFSHSQDALLIGWSTHRLGVDIERSDRSFKADQLTQRFFCHQDRQQLLDLQEEQLRTVALSQWVIKEAAIKWQRGTLAADLDQWQCENSLSGVVHLSQGHRLRVDHVCVGPWMIAVAQKYSLHSRSSMVCLGLDG